MISIGGKGSKSSASTHRVKLSLAAVTRTREKFLTSDKPTAPVPTS